LYHNVPDLANVCSNYGSSLLQKGPAVPHCPLEEVLCDAPSDGLDLVSKLLVFNPHKRLTAEQALQHVYVQRYVIGLNQVHYLTLQSKNIIKSRTIFVDGEMSKVQTLPVIPGII
jgi:serine/threonine protein kinase